MMSCKQKYDGKKFMERLNIYNGYLETVLKQVDDFTVKGKHYYQILDKQMGPPHLWSKIDKSSISTMMNLTMDKVDDMENIINRTAKLWDQIKAVYANRSHEEDTVAVLVDDLKIVEG